MKAQETRHDPDQRYAWKLRLIKSLYQRGYEKQDILELFRFIDWLLELPEGLEEQLWNELETYERGEVMPYVTSVERIGIKKGMVIGEEKGIPQGEALILRRLLTRRFGALPEWVETNLTQASTAQLEHWADRILDADALDAVFVDQP